MAMSDGAKLTTAIIAPMTIPFLYGGGKGDKAKAAAHSEDIARQTQEIINILESYGSQLTPGSEEWLTLQTAGQELIDRASEGAFPVSALGGESLDQQPAATKLGQMLVSKQGQRIASGGSASPLEARTDKAFGGLREAAAPSSYEQDILDALGGGQIDTPLGQAYASQIGRAGSTTIDDSVFKNALKLVEDRVNQEAAGRGILGGGLRLEQLGRAGVDASIAEAQRQDALRQEAFTNTQSIAGEGESLRNRAIGLESDLVSMQLGRESNLTGILNQNAQISQANRQGTAQSREAQAIAGRLDAQDAEAAQRAALGQALGTGLAVAAAPFTGGASLALAPAAGQIGGSLAGGGSSSGSSSQLLAATRQPQAQAAPAQSLSIQGQGGLDIQQLLKLLQAQQSQPVVSV